ncbi:MULTISPECIES: LAETG motif-containing sortase-dependent surface protein [unclassified Streptomyces]|uniref:LAETG motif-containing sortase-dependent surface protein n=1 Tax=Streptomyces niveiscabiei TaxID=164115 RepID=A0ABW9I6V2_9ACTN|nr:MULTISPECIES: LAETG motif-containing sortase-dependent surface protein [unclassified Streptomyces]QZZ29696.1 LPXTG cell wall anchor domain-containing protein [Streptomyces sp. ST1015]
MKLRRAIAVAAATAALSPLVLMSAPSAFAEDGTSASPSPSVSASESAPEAAPSSPAADDTTGDDKGSASPSTSSSSTPSGSASGTPTGTPSASTSVSSTPSAPAEVDYCETLSDEDEIQLSESLSTGLSNLPEKIVAGSGWHNFSFDVANDGKETIKNIKPFILVGAESEDSTEDYSGGLTLQVFQPSSGKWITLEDGFGDATTFSTLTLSAGNSTSYKLRIAVDGKVPDSIGFAIGLATYSDAKSCWVGNDPNGAIYEVQILAAGSKPGKPGNAKPQTGGAKPVNLNDVEVTGSLAETGSSSALPMIGLVGGAAVVAGAGAIFIVRRRKADGSHA